MDNQQHVEGVVTAVGTKFTGSLKIRDKWYSNAKGFQNPAKKGDFVTLTLSPWTSNGKSGVNITAVEMIPTNNGVEKLKDVVAKDVARNPNLGRDFDAENRGKVRHGLMAVLMPLIATDTVSLDKAKELVEQVVPFVMGK